MMPEVPTGPDLGVENASANPDNLWLSTFISSNCGNISSLKYAEYVGEVRASTPAAKGAAAYPEPRTIASVPKSARFSKPSYKLSAKSVARTKVCGLWNITCFF